MNELETGTVAPEKIIILMAVYNGEKFISEQIESIIQQTHSNWELIIRDDGSTDQTITIIKNIAQKDDRIVLIDPPNIIKSACGNFSTLFDWARINRKFNYLMFSDQDDIWKINKIEVSLNTIKTHEHARETPLLVYGDLSLMNEDKSLINYSYKIFSDLKLNNLLIQNYAFGCTMMLNDKLVEKIGRIEKNAENHDYWIALVASAFGKCIFIREKLIFYRLHNTNVTSQRPSTLKDQITRYTLELQKKVISFKNRYSMLCLFYETYGGSLTKPDKILISNYIESLKKNRILVLYRMVQRKMYRYGMMQNLAQLYFITFFFTKINKAIGQLSK